MPEEEITKEREKIKELIETKANKLIELREDMKNCVARRRVSMSQFKRFVEVVLFRIDNPDYIRVKDRAPEQEQNTTPTQDF
jgi:superfamily II helicase